MKCRFCGKKIKKGENTCSKCGKEVTEGLATDELIDAMPELHDEFDNISKMQARDKRKKEIKEMRAKNKTKRIVIAIILVVAILCGVAGGIFYFKNIENNKEEVPQIVASSAIESLIEKAIAPVGFTETLITDATSAKEVLKEAASTFSITDVDSEFELDRELQVGDTKFYRFKQMYQNIPVQSGAMILMADSDGNVITINGVYVPTKGLTTEYKITPGSASTSITEYVNHLGQYSVVQAINITEIEKAVCNSGGKAYLAYKANVSGYNKNGEYVAYNVFVDGVNGNGICATPTSSFENESVITQEEIENSYIYEMATVSDKFNWNDESMALTEEPINIKDVDAGNSSAYITSIKTAVDNAYNFFDKSFGWKGLSGSGDSFKVYVNSNEYVEEVLPTEKALYTNNKLMFFREDLTQGDVDYNTVVHEYAHGVMNNIVGFCGTIMHTENSTIAEGLADVFAEFAEAKMLGTAPDWIHSSRNLLNPEDGYHTSCYDNMEITSVEDCYRHSTIVSHLAAYIADGTTSFSAQSEMWFKVMCLMTDYTDCNDFQTLLPIVAMDMYEKGNIEDIVYSKVVSGVQMIEMAQEDIVYNN